MKLRIAWFLSALVIATACGPREGEVWIYNHSGQRTAKVLVDICGQRLEFGLQYDGEFAHQPFRITCKTAVPFLDVTLESGTRFAEGEGFPTLPTATRYNFEIGLNGIRLMGTLP